MSTGSITLPVPQNNQGANFVSLPFTVLNTFTDNKSVEMNGVNQYTDAGIPPNLDFQWNQPMWLGAWVYLRNTLQNQGITQNTTSVHGRMAIIGKSWGIDETPSHLGFHLICMDNALGDNRQFMLYIITSYPTPAHYLGVQSPNYTIPLNQWFRIDAASLDGTYANAKLWFNGVEQTTHMESDNAQENLTGYSSHFTVGSHDGVASFVNGFIDDPIIANFYPTQNDIDLVNSKTPIDLSKTKFSQPIISTWRMGDQDTAPFIKDRVSSNDLILMNGAKFSSRSRFEQVIVNDSWSPAACDGTKVLWIDTTDDSTLTINSGVSSIKDKSSNQWIYNSVGTTNPTLGTLNGLQCLVGNGSQYFEMEIPTRLINKTDRFILGLAGSIDSNASSFPSFFQDGEGINGATILGCTTVSFYVDTFFGADQNYLPNAIFPSHWTFGYSFPQKTVFTIEKTNQLGNDASYYIGTSNGVSPVTNESGLYGPNIEIGRLMAALSSNALVGKLGELVIIRDPSASDISNLKAYLTRRWGT